MHNGDPIERRIKLDDFRVRTQRKQHFRRAEMSARGPGGAAHTLWRHNPGANRDRPPSNLPALQRTVGA